MSACGMSIDCEWGCPGCLPKPATCDGCGKPEGSFACKIRHIQINTGDAKAARD